MQAQPLMTLVDWKKYRFIIMDAPNEVNLHAYVEHLRKHGVTDVVRVCEEQTYAPAKLEDAGIKAHVRSGSGGAAGGGGGWLAPLAQSDCSNFVAVAGLPFPRRRGAAAGRAGPVAELGRLSLQARGRQRDHCRALRGGPGQVRAPHDPEKPVNVFQLAFDRHLFHSPRPSPHRAPVLVAIALIEAGLEWEQAVEHIRSKRCAIRAPRCCRCA